MDDLGYEIWQAQAYIDKVLEQLQNRPQDISQKRLKYIRDSLNYVENDIRQAIDLIDSIFDNEVS